MTAPQVTAGPFTILACGEHWHIAKDGLGVAVNGRREFSDTEAAAVAAALNRVERGRAVAARLGTSDCSDPEFPRTDWADLRAYVRQVEGATAESQRQLAAVTADRDNIMWYALALGALFAGMSTKLGCTAVPTTTTSRQAVSDWIREAGQRMNEVFRRAAR